MRPLFYVIFYKAHIRSSKPDFKGDAGVMVFLWVCMVWSLESALPPTSMWSLEKKKRQWNKEDPMGDQSQLMAATESFKLKGKGFHNLLKLDLPHH